MILCRLFYEKMKNSPHNTEQIKRIILTIMVIMMLLPPLLLWLFGGIKIV
jgi:hypothetical protein